MKTIEKKTLYLCDGCRKMGVRSSRSKVFESFFCPKCNMETTLILPAAPARKDNPSVDETPRVRETEQEPKAFRGQAAESESPKFVGVKPLISLVDVLIFMAGFISAIIILKG